MARNPNPRTTMTVFVYDTALCKTLAIQLTAKSIDIDYEFSNELGKLYRYSNCERFGLAAIQSLYKKYDTVAITLELNTTESEYGTYIRVRYQNATGTVGGTRRFRLIAAVYGSKDLITNYMVREGYTVSFQTTLDNGSWERIIENMTHVQPYHI